MNNQLSLDYNRAVQLAHITVLTSLPGRTVLPLTGWPRKEGGGDGREEGEEGRRRRPAFGIQRLFFETDVCD